MSSPPKPRVRRERDRFEDLERRSRGELKDRPSRERPAAATAATTGAAAAAAPAVQMPPRAPHHHRRSGSISSSSSPTTTATTTTTTTATAASASANSPQASPTRSDRPTTAGATPTYPNYYDYSENAEILHPAPTQRQQQQQQQLQLPTAAINMAMQVPIPPQQAPQHRLVDHPASSHPAALPSHSHSHSNSHSNSSASRLPAGPAGPPQLTTAQLAQAARIGSGSTITNGANTHHRVSSSGSRDRPPSFAASQNVHGGSGGGSAHGQGAPRASFADDTILPPNKVDLDAARYRHAQQQSRRDRADRGDRDRDRDRDRPVPPAKDPRDHPRRPSQTSSNSNTNTNNSANTNNGRPPSLTMPAQQQQHHHQHHLTRDNAGRPVSPESLPTPTGMMGGPAIQRMPTPSVFTSVLQPLDAKVGEYGSLMVEAQGDMARLDDEMRALQERQREAEQRFLEAKAKHDDYRRQYVDVERALRGEFAMGAHGSGIGSGSGSGRDREVAFERGEVPPMPSMPSLQQYGVGTAPGGGGNGSGNLLNGQHHHGGGGPPPGMRSQRTVSIQSDAESLNGGYGRPSSKRGRWSRVFGIGT